MPPRRDDDAASREMVLNRRYRAGCQNRSNLRFSRCAGTPGEISHVRTALTASATRHMGVSPNARCPCCEELVDPYGCACPPGVGNRRGTGHNGRGLDTWRDDLGQVEEDPALTS